MSTREDPLKTKFLNGMGKKLKLKDSLEKVLAANKLRAKINKKQVELANPQSHVQIISKSLVPMHRWSNSSTLSDIPFRNGSRILLVGEGNLSYAVALSRKVQKPELISATVFDTESDLYRKYAEAEANVKILQDAGAKVLFEVDATQLLQKGNFVFGQQFDRIIFNFPHVGAGIKDVERNIVQNQKLLKGFFTQASEMLSRKGMSPDKLIRRSVVMSHPNQTKILAGSSRKRSRPDLDSDEDVIEEEQLYFSDEDSSFELEEGEILVTLKDGEPYDSWQIKKLATSTGKLVCKESFPFLPNRYPGYEHRRTFGEANDNFDAEFMQRACRTFVFTAK